MKFETIRSRILAFQEQGLRVFATSSFQTQSVPLLHMISRIDAAIPVVFLNTGYLFPETLSFRDSLVDTFGLTAREVSSPVPRHLQRDGDGRLLFCSDTEYCCYLNKVLPMEGVLADFDVWVNGVRREQTAVRQSLSEEEDAGNGVRRFHPLLDWTREMIEDYVRVNELPRHPLDERGFGTIGCEPCTIRSQGADSRQGRWFGSEKTECGLHTDLVRRQ